MSQSVEKKVEEIVEGISSLGLSDVSLLIKCLKERLDLPDIPFAAGVVQASGQSTSGESSAKEEKSEYTLSLKSFGDKKANVIKAVKGIMKKLGKDMTLSEIKHLVESAPVKIAESVAKDDGNSYLEILKDAGADADLK